MYTWTMGKPTVHVYPPHVYGSWVVQLRRASDWGVSVVLSGDKTHADALTEARDLQREYTSPTTGAQPGIVDHS